jgi:hypothetical protein
MGVNERKQKMFIVTYTDYGETCDGHSRLLGVFPTVKDAQKEMSLDIRRLIAAYGRNDCTYIPASNEVWKEVGKVGCVWDIHEVQDPR